MNSTNSNIPKWVIIYTLPTKIDDDTARALFPLIFIEGTLLLGIYNDEYSHTKNVEFWKISFAKYIAEQFTVQVSRIWNSIKYEFPDSELASRWFKGDPQNFVSILNTIAGKIYFKCIFSNNQAGILYLGPGSPPPPGNKPTGTIVEFTATRAMSLAVNDSIYKQAA